MGTGFSIFRQVEITIDLLGERHTDPALDQKTQPYNLSTMSSLGINYITIRLTLARRLIPTPHQRTQETTR